MYKEGHTYGRCQGATPGGDLGLRDPCVGFSLLEISFVSSGSRLNAFISLCLYHDYRLRQKQGGDQRADEYFYSSYADPSFPPVSRLVYNERYDRNGLLIDGE